MDPKLKLKSDIVITTSDANHSRSMKQKKNNGATKGFLGGPAVPALRMNYDDRQDNMVQKYWIYQTTSKP